MSRLGLVLAVALLAFGGAGTARAQNPFEPAILVNSSVITHYDIDQRAALLNALGARGDLRKQAIDQLTEDRLKIQAAKEMEIELPEGAIYAGIEEFAAQRGLTMDDVFEAMAARNIDRQTMDDFVEAGLMWREVVSTRFRQKAMPSEGDLDAAMAQVENQPVEMVEMSEIALPFAERGEAETLALAERLSRQLQGGSSFAAAAREYSRSQSAVEGGRMPPVPAAGMPPAIRSQVLLLRPGQVTRPIPIGGGVAILRLDGIRQAPPQTRPAEMTDEDARNRLREQVFAQRITTFGQGYLQELQRDALIVNR